MAPKSPEKRVVSLPTVCSCVLLATLLLPTVMQASRHMRHGRLVATHDFHQLAVTPPSGAAVERRLTFVTLCFNQPNIATMVDHNCAMLTRGGYKFEIYTDDISQGYCRTCSCKLFRLTNCTCPQPERSDCSLCEKLAFIVALSQSMDSYVFIDSDLVILADRFMPALEARAVHFDFMAAYGFGLYQNWRYTAQFNSGLMFLRRLPDVNYTKMIDIMYEMGTNNDQNVISSFIHSYYTNWDALSLRWHCRYLYRKENNINPSHCLTFHGRGRALENLINSSTFQLLSSRDLPRAQFWQSWRLKNHSRSARFRCLVALPVSTVLYECTVCVMRRYCYWKSKLSVK